MKADKELTENTKLAFSLTFLSVVNRFPSLLPSQTSNNCTVVLSTHLELQHSGQKYSRGKAKTWLGYIHMQKLLSILQKNYSSYVKGSPSEVNTSFSCIFRSYLVFLDGLFLCQYLEHLYIITIIFSLPSPLQPATNPLFLSTQPPSLPPGGILDDQ